MRGTYSVGCCEAEDERELGVRRIHREMLPGPKMGGSGLKTQ